MTARSPRRARPVSPRAARSGFDPWIDGGGGEVGLRRIRRESSGGKGLFGREPCRHDLIGEDRTVGRSGRRGRCHPRKAAGRFRPHHRPGRWIRDPAARAQQEQEAGGVQRRSACHGPAPGPPAKYHQSHREPTIKVARTRRNESHTHCVTCFAVAPRTRSGVTTRSGTKNRLAEHCSSLVRAPCWNPCPDLAALVIGSVQGDEQSDHGEFTLRHNDFDRSVRRVRCCAGMLEYSSVPRSPGSRPMTRSVTSPDVSRGPNAEFAGSDHQREQCLADRVRCSVQIGKEADSDFVGTDRQRSVSGEVRTESTRYG